jgi:hypothetical protein
MVEKVAETPPSDNLSTRDEKPSQTQLEKFDTFEEQLQIDPTADKKITRKFDTHIVPWLFGLWLLAFIDRSNIGNARIDGLAKDLNILDGNKFNITLAIFYVPYIVVDGMSLFLLLWVSADFN